MPELLTAAAARFAEAVRQLIGPNADTAVPFKIGLAVSGGPDSLAMMLIAAHAYPGQICAATVDHGLRPEAADEAAHVASIAQNFAISHAILRVDQPITGNVQAGARRARYALLEQWADDHGCPWIATAHHADDQIETLLMRLARGAGVAGLAGVRRRNGRIIRPMLSFNKAELASICAESGVVPVHDPSNINADFDRVRMRQWLASGDQPISGTAVLRSASALSDAHDALEWAAEQLAKERLNHEKDGVLTIDARGIPRELQRRLLLIGLAHIAPSLLPRGETIDRGLDVLNGQGKLTIGDILCASNGHWCLSPAPPRRH